MLPPAVKMVNHMMVTTVLVAILDRQVLQVAEPELIIIIALEQPLQEVAVVVAVQKEQVALLKLVVVPVVYSLLQDLRRGLPARRPVMVRAKAKPPAEEEQETPAPRFQRVPRTPKEKK